MLVKDRFDRKETFSKGEGKGGGKEEMCDFMHVLSLSRKLGIMRGR